MLSEGRSSTNTHIYFSSFHGRLLPQISFCDPYPTVFLSFYFFPWIQAGFKAKAAFDLSRLVNLPTNLPALTSNFTITLKKHPQIYRKNCPNTQILLLPLTKTGRWKEIFFHEQKLEKRFTGPEIKMPRATAPLRMIGL